MKAPLPDNVGAVEPDKDGFLDDAAIVKRPIDELTKKNRVLADHNAIVIHNIVGNSANSALIAFKSGVGAHFVVNKDGSRFQIASLH